MNVIQAIFGDGRDLDVVQMTCRGALVFVITLLLVRVSGRRSFGQHSPFDACTTVLLGAILSRAVVGASDFWPTIAAGTVLAAMHRLVGELASRSPRFERFVSGPTITLFASGEFRSEAMRRALVSRYDIEQAARTAIQADDLSKIREAVLERNGSISVVTDR